MLSILFWPLAFLASLAVLVKASDIFTDSAERIGISLGVSPFIVGVTIISVGTSTPELVSSILAVLKGSPEIVVGNVMGSNVTNIFLVLGISSIVGKKMVAGYELANVDLPLVIGSAALLTLMVWDGVYSYPEALLSIAFLLVYLAYIVRAERVADEVRARSLGGEIVHWRKRKLDMLVYMKLILGIFFLYLGANYTIVSVVRLSEMTNLGT
ncbi:MAG: sodium:calcium antiporter, partial [Methanothrix sp.]